VFFSLSIKWILSILNFELNINSLSLFNLEDTQYFPIVYSLADFNFSPTYLDNVYADKIIGFPLIGASLHSIFFSFMGIYSFMVLEYLFQIIFLIILFKFCLMIFKDHRKSFYFFIFLMLLYSIFGIITIYQDSTTFENLYYLFKNNFGTRYPRPLITGVLIFLGLYFILDFKNQLHQSFDSSYVAKTSIILGLLLNTFFYYFIIFSVLLFIVFCTSFSKKIFSKIVFKKAILFLIILSVFIIPFIFQNIYSEIDYSTRIGVIEINNDKRYFVITYLLKKLVSINFFPFLCLSLLSFYYSNKYLKKDSEMLNIFFYFIISSILSTIVFISFSPSVISIYHFVDIILFSFVLYPMLIFFTVIYEFLKKTKFSKILINDKVIIALTAIFLMLDGFYAVNDFSKKKESIKEAIKLENFLDDKKLHNTKLNFFPMIE